MTLGAHHPMTREPVTPYTTNDMGNFKHGNQCSTSTTLQRFNIHIFETTPVDYYKFIL